MKWVTVLVLFLLLLPGALADAEVIGLFDEYAYTETIFVTPACNETLTVDIESLDALLNDLPVTSPIKITDCTRINAVTYSPQALEKTGWHTRRIQREFSLPVPYTYTIRYSEDYVLEKSFPEPTFMNAMTKEVTFGESDIFILEFTEQETWFVLHSLLDEFDEIEVLLLLVISFALGGFVTFHLQRRRRKKHPVVPSFVLTGEEKKLLLFVKNNPGVNQKRIAQELNTSKARASAMIGALEEKKLIRRKREGRHSKVFVAAAVV